MNDVGELMEYAAVHARAQDISPALYREVLARISSDDSGMPGSWVREWCVAAERLVASDHLLEAFRHYNMARFPYPDGPARQYATERCVSVFDRWRQQEPSIQSREIDLAGRTARCWTSGLSATDRRPVLLIMGGIVTLKEQWAPVLARLGRTGMAGVVAEMPGVGENALPYDTESWRMLSALLDAISHEADVAHTYAMTMSFSGHLALRCAVEDHRIRGIVTAGAPVSDFFTDVRWQQDLPSITIDTLAHLTGTTAAGLPAGLCDWALSAEQLAALDIPIYYLASSRDEIIPAGELRHLRQHVRDLHLIENDDVHGSPRHVAETRLWAALSVLRMRRVHNLQRLAVSSMWRAAWVHSRVGPGSRMNEHTLDRAKGVVSGSGQAVLEGRK